MALIKIEDIDVLSHITPKADSALYFRARRQTISGKYSAEVLLRLQQCVRGFRADTVSPELFAPDIPLADFLAGLAEQPTDNKLRMLVASYLEAVAPDALPAFIGD